MKPNLAEPPLSDPLSIMTTELQDEDFNMAYTTWARSSTLEEESTELTKIQFADIFKLLSEISLKYQVPITLVLDQFILVNKRFGNKLENYFCANLGWNKESLENALIVSQYLAQNAHRILEKELDIIVSPLNYNGLNLYIALSKIAERYQLPITEVISIYTDFCPEDEEIINEYIEELQN